MPLHYRGIVQSKPFRFLVGPEMSEFFLHPALITQYSKPLEALIHGKMREAREEIATIDDVDADTFARFCEYLYTGNYTPTEYSEVLDSSLNRREDGVNDKEDTQAQSSADDSWRGLTLSKKKKKKQAQRQMRQPGDLHPHSKLWEDFSSRTWTTDISATIGRPNKKPSEDYSDVFLSHARVYVFADRYDVKELRSIVLEQLHGTLVQFDLYPERVGDIARLLQYTYENTAEREGCMDPLRELVVEYVACYVENIVANDVFEAVLKAETSASVDLTKMLLRRLN